MSHALLQASGLRLSLGGRDVLADVSLSLHAGTRTALLGRNGAGKTTLLHALAGVAAKGMQPADGAVWRRPELRLAYLGQYQHFAAGETVAQVLAAANPYRALYAEAEALAAQLGHAAALARWSEIQDTLQRRKAAAWPARQSRILAELGLAELGSAELELAATGAGGWAEREVSTLSGGERTRLALALMLAREPDLLLLDEPTNHLDIRMREWLEGWLRATFHAGSAGAVLLTSHDRDFLDAVVGRSLWLEDGQLSEYAGGYTRATEQRALERRALRRAARRGEAERGRLGQSAGRLNVWGSSARAVQSRRRRIAVPEAPTAERQLRMRLLAGDARAELLAWGQHLSVSYGRRAVLRGVRFRLRRGDRVALLGANGTGKSTLLRLLAGELKPNAGPPAPELHFAAGVSVAYLDQIWHGLRPQHTLLAQFRARFGDRAPALLGQAGFAADDWERCPDTLSGGERARAGLALVSGLRADLLLLDEPTNHLDVQALASLEAAVQAYGGALVMVTHDRRFARTVATRLWLLEGGELREVDRWNGHHYTDPARVLDADPPPAPPAPTPLERVEALEDEVLALRARLDEAQAGRVPLSGREEARVFAALHALEPQLWQVYAEAFAAPAFDAQVPEPVAGMGRVWVRGLHLGEAGLGGVFWAAVQDGPDEASPFDGPHFDRPHLAWDGETLRFLPQVPEPPALAQALLGGALRILFERWNVGRVRLGTGPIVRRREWFERLALAK